MIRLSRPNVSEEAIAAVADILRSGQLVHGPEGELFEQELASYLGCRDAVLVSSGTAALHLALLGMDIGPGDAVLVPDFTFPATANVVVMAGARPVMVDVLPDTYCMNPELLRQVVEAWRGPERLRAIMPVHEFGCLADMHAIMRIAADHDLLVIEDAACALGADWQGRKAGTFGRVGCFSFHPRKTLTTGEGGALATDDIELAHRLRRLRSHGMERTEAGLEFTEASLNYRLTNFQAALGRRQLPQLDGWIASRRLLAAAYGRLLAPAQAEGLLRLPVPQAGHSWQTYMVVLGQGIQRQDVIAALRERGVEANLGAQSLSSLGLYGSHELLRHGSELFSLGLALPMFEQMSVMDVEQVCRALLEVLSG